MGLIAFNDLSTPLKLLVIAGWISIIGQGLLYMVAFLIGFVQGV